MTCCPVRAPHQPHTHSPRANLSPYDVVAMQPYFKVATVRWHTEVHYQALSLNQKWVGSSDTATNYDEGQPVNTAVSSATWWFDLLEAPGFWKGRIRAKSSGRACVRARACTCACVSHNKALWGLASRVRPSPLKWGHFSFSSLLSLHFMVKA